MAGHARSNCLAVSCYLRGIKGQFFSLASLRAMLSRDFEDLEIVPIRGKMSHRFPSLFAHKLAWRGRTPGAEGASSAG